MTHRRVNNILSILVVLLGLYIAAAPLLPNLTFWWKKRSGFEVPAYAQDNPQENQSDDTIPKDNRLVIPSLGLNEVIHEGQSEYTANKGVWRRPQTSMPGKGSNTVLVGHRFSYSTEVKDPFYHLDKVVAGEPIVVAWEGKAFRYRVTEIKVVEATAVEIESASPTEMLTIYTCTPIWTSEKRLVIIAIPEEKRQ